LRLDQIEALYLEEVGRLELTNDRDPDFQTRYRNGPDTILRAAYNDLRDRGLVVKHDAESGYLRVWGREGGPKDPPSYHLYPVEEREPFDLEQTLTWARKADERKVTALAGVVDEEGGLTYFELTLPDPAGGEVDHRPGRIDGKATLVDELLTVKGDPACRSLEGAGYGRRVGERYRLSLLEGLYLAQEWSLAIGGPEGLLETPALAWKVLKLQADLPLRLAVYRYLRGLDYLPKTGFKFGTHFRIYDRPLGQGRLRPHGGHTDRHSFAGSGHAPWLVHAHPADFKGSWPGLARTVRLAHGVRKKLWLARVTDEAAEAALRGETLDEGVGLLEVGWIRP